MAKERKTVDVWEIQGNYGMFWETLCCENTLEEAEAQLHCYDKNEWQYEHRIKHHRIPKERYARGDF
ncbi:MAG: hypothetical protein IJ741_03515 [Schwartzia sp.]|nr:hypothetical protein [Schwartzia sp. (in: firmicutes)]